MEEDRRMSLSLEEIIQLEREKRFIKNVSEIKPVRSAEIIVEKVEMKEVPKQRAQSPKISSTFYSNFYKRNGFNGNSFNRVHFHPYQRKVTFDPSPLQETGVSQTWRNGYRSKLKQSGGNSFDRRMWNSRDESVRNYRSRDRSWIPKNNLMRRSSSVCSNDSRCSFGSNMSLNSNFSFSSKNSDRSTASHWSGNSTRSFSSRRRGRNFNFSRRPRNNYWQGKFRHRWFPNREVTQAIKQTIEHFSLDSSSCKLLKVGNVHELSIVPKHCDFTLNERFQYLCFH